MKRTETDASEINPLEANPSETTLSQEATPQPDNAPRADLLPRETAPSADTKASAEEETLNPDLAAAMLIDMGFADIVSNQGVEEDGLLQGIILNDNPDSSPDTKEAEQFMISAYEAIEQQQIIEAEENFKQALQKYREDAYETKYFSPRIEECLYQLANIYFQQGRSADEEACYADIAGIGLQRESTAPTGDSTGLDLDVLLSSATPAHSSFSLFSQATSQPARDENEMRDGDTASNRNNPSAS